MIDKLKFEEDVLKLLQKHKLIPNVKNPSMLEIGRAEIIADAMEFPSIIIEYGHIKREGKVTLLRRIARKIRRV